MEAACLSVRFLAWLSRAGWVASRFDDDGAFDDSGNCAIWQEDAAGRTISSYLFHIGEDDWFEVSDGDARRAMFAAAALDTVERYFWGLLADVIRQGSKLPRLAEQDRLAEGYRIGEDGRGGRGLIGPGGTLLARGGEEYLVALSRYLPPSLDELEAALLDPEGKPFFLAWNQHR